RQATALSLGIADPLSVQLSWRLLLLAAGYAFVRWNAATARTWTPAVLAARRPLVPVAFCTVLGVALLSVWLGHVYPSGPPGFQMLPPLPGPLRFLPSPLDYLGFVFSLTAVSTPPALLLAVVATTAALPLAAPLGARLGARLAHRAPRPTPYLDGPGRFLLWPPTPEQSARLLALPRLRPVRAVATGLVLGTAAALALWLAHVVSAVVFPAPIERLGGVFALYMVPVAILLPLAIGFFVGRRAARHELRALHGVLAALGAGLTVPAAAFTARDHFACVRWGLDHPACEVVPPFAGMSGVTLTITAWTALLALLLLPAWATAYDAVRQRTTCGQSSP
ncbi:MAG: hypothetical protein LBV60_17435, partial [Streptomyces sp.]|nr:hypothetical protein [Streptomyces sp.]